MSLVEPEEKKIHLVQGEYKVSDDPRVVFSTILGSCVGACIRDPVRGVGGMNHFLLPGPEVGADARDVERIGLRDRRQQRQIGLGCRHRIQKIGELAGEHGIRAAVSEI